MTTPDYPDWQAGAVLGHGASSLVGQSTQTLPGGAGVSLGIFSILGLGIDMSLQLAMPINTGTVPFAQLTAQWNDTVTGQLTWVDFYKVACGNASVLTHVIQILTKGDQLSLSLSNFDPAVTLTYNFAATLHGRPQDHDRGMQTTIGGVNGFNQPGGLPQTGEHCNVSTAIGPNANITRLMPFSMGKHRITTSNLSGANNMSVAITDAVSGDLIGKWAVPAGGSDGRDFNLPSAQCLLTLANTQAANTITPNFTSMRQDY